MIDYRSLFLMFFSSISTTLAADLWVDVVNGDDNQTGLTATAAFKTLKMAAIHATPGTIVHIQPGIYRETITPSNSGQMEAPIIYQAEQGQDTVVIRGSELAVTWNPLTENSIGLPETVDITQIVWANLSTWDLTQTPRFVVSINGERQRFTLAREPDWVAQTDWKQQAVWWTAEGGATVANCHPPTDQDRRNCDKASRSTTQLIDIQDEQPPIEAGNLTTLGDLTGATLVAAGTVQGSYLFRRTIITHDVNAGKVTVDPPAERASTTNQAGLGWGSKFYVENHPALLDTPGEYWFDLTTKRLYLFSPTTELASIEISSRDSGWILTDRSYLILKDLNLELFNGKAITIENTDQQGSHHLHFQNVKIFYADQGLTVQQTLTATSPPTAGTDHLTLENSTFSDMDTQAVNLSGQWDNATHPPITQTTLRHNIFHHVGFRSQLDVGAGISVTYPDHFRFENNTLYHVASNGIMFNQSIIQSDKAFAFVPTEIKTGTILVKDNVIEKTCLALAVCSGIRFSGSAPDSHVFREVLITGNTLRHQRGWAYASAQRGWWANGEGGYGLFLDGTSGVHVYRNVFYDNGWANIMLVREWRDGEIIIWNNVLADAYHGLEMWNNAALNTRSQVDTQLQHNIIVNNERYGFQHVLAPTTDETHFKSDNNLYYANGWGKNGGVMKASDQFYQTLAEIQTSAGWEMNSVDGDPTFIHYDYALAQQGALEEIDFHLRIESAALRQTMVSLPPSLQTLVAQFNVERDIVQNIGAFERFYTQGLAITADNQPIDTKTYFSGTITTATQQGDTLTVTSTDDLTITADLLVATADVEQPANIILVGGYTAPSTGQLSYYTRQEMQWRTWDGQLSTLAVAEKVTHLPQQQTITIYQGNFADIPGEFVVYVGYQLPDGVVVFNGQRTIRFTVVNF